MLFSYFKNNFLGFITFLKVSSKIKGNALISFYMLISMLVID